MQTLNNKRYHNATKIAIILFVLGISFILLGFLYKKESCPVKEKKFKKDNLQVISKDTTIIPVQLEQRESITFILGEDREEDNPYYAQAENYYRFNPEGKTEYIVTSCRSLLEVRDYLANNTTSNNLPWGQVNLVSHGNQWLGLSVRVLPESKRATVEHIQECIDSGLFKPLLKSILDDKSIIFVHGCGVGNNPELIEAICTALGGNDTLPQVKSSIYFEYYSSTVSNGLVTDTRRYFAKVWYTIYKKGYRPENTILSHKLNKQYPNCAVNWQDALGREQPRWDGDIYHYTFEVPVKWVIPYPDKESLPDVSTLSKQLEWICTQKDIVETLEKMNIPKEKFNWWFRNVYVNNDDGAQSPAIWVKGYSTILCVIQPIVDC